MNEPDDIEGLLESLADARTSAQLAEAHHEIKRRIRKGRAIAGTSVLAQSIAAAIENWDLQKADGVSVEERQAGLERTVRAAWPRTREWNYLCSSCRDTGLTMHVCRAGARCDGISTRIDFPKDKPGKYTSLCTRGDDRDEHDYGVPCWCDKGRRFRAKPTQASDADEMAARVPKKPTRFGR